ncbi:MAG: hypothetical protein H6Q66_1945 [Firmicutes bacterium]|nr:hypothetical protein [Bacillota bacterium]
MLGNLDFTGADNRIRTYDPLITNEMLYQLSYTGADSLFILPAISENVKASSHFFTSSYSPHHFQYG